MTALGARLERLEQATSLPESDPGWSTRFIAECLSGCDPRDLVPTPASDDLFARFIAWSNDFTAKQKAAGYERA